MSHSQRFQQLAADAKSRIREVTAKAAAEQQKSGALLVDVRETEEFAKEHALGAIHLSRGTIELKIEQHAPEMATPIVCYCGGGNRSALVADNLQKMGYTNVASLAGGFKSWKDEGLPTA
jgi:phage shock protein E